MATSATGRDEQVDALKGLAILLVLLGHTLIFAYGLFPGMHSRLGAGDSWVPNAIAVIYGFHMPLFMALAGYVTFGRVPDRLGVWVGGKALRLLVPFIVWYSLPYVLGRQGPYGGPLGYLAGLPRYLAGGLAAPQNGLWFLFVLFWCYSVLALFVGVDRRRAGWWTLAVLLGVALLCELTGINVVGLPLIGQPGLWFAVGYLFAQYRESSLLARPALRIAAAAVYPVLAVLAVTRPDLTLGATGLPLRLLLAASGIAMCAAAIGAIRQTVASRGFAWFGRRTMEIYVCHMFILGVYASSLGLPLLLSPFGIVADAALVLAAALALGALLDLTTPSRALFLGGWPRSPRALPRPATVQ